MKVEIRGKNRWTLVGVEILAIGILTPLWLARKYDWDFLTGLVVGIVIILLIGFLFFRMRLFRYLFAILFSVFWGLLGYVFAGRTTDSDTTPWIVFFLVIVISLYLHKDYLLVQPMSNA